MTIYDKAVDYAFNLNSSFCKDIVHDAYVNYFEKNNKNLFDQGEAVVMKYIKKIYNSDKRFHQRVVVFRDGMRQNTVTPEDEFIEGELGLSFVSYEDITVSVESYEQYHTMYPKIYLN